VISLFLPQITRDLSLVKHGLEILPRDPSSFTPFSDGRGLLLGHDMARNREEIARFSRRDAEAYPAYEAYLARIASILRPAILAPIPELPPRLRDLRTWWRYGRIAKRLGSDLHDALSILAAPATRILDRWFESEPLRATFATDAIIGALVAPSTPGSAYVLLHHVMGDAGGKRGVWGYVRGGMGGLADALEKACLAAGVAIRRSAEVARIRLRGGRAAGITLAGGTEIAAPVVASSVDARHTFLEFLEARDVPGGFRERVKSIDYAAASMKINLALDGLPRFETGGIPPAVALRGTVHIAPAVAYIERAFDDARHNRASEAPVLEVTIPSTVDESLAPPGKHVMSIFAQYTPYRLVGTDWDHDGAAYADRTIDLLAAYAPDIRERILHRQVLTPLDLERTYGLTGGSIMQGAMSLDQLGPLRLGYRPPIPGLYLCGAATHPGGGVMGACGRNAAREILRDRGAGIPPGSPSARI